MAKVYLLTEGEYSNYHIKGAFSTREAAEAAKDGFERNREPYHDRIKVEEYELDAMVDFAVGPTWSVTIRKADGRFASQPYEQRDFRHPSAIEVDEYADYFFVVSPISGDHVIKVAVEARQKWLRDRATGAT